MITAWRLALSHIALSIGALAAPSPSFATGSSGGGLGWPPGGGSACEITAIYSATPAVANLGTYAPPGTPSPVPVNITMSLKTSGSGTCYRLDRLSPV